MKTAVILFISLVSFQVFSETEFIRAVYGSSAGCGSQEKTAIELARSNARTVCRQAEKSLLETNPPVIVHRIRRSCWAGHDSAAVAFFEFQCSEDNLQEVPLIHSDHSRECKYPEGSCMHYIYCRGQWPPGDCSNP